MTRGLQLALRSLTWLAVAVSAAACRPRAVNQTQAELPLAALPLTNVDGMPFVRVSTDGAPAHLWLLDSGFETSVVNSRFADSLHLAPHRLSEKGVPGGETGIAMVAGIPLHLGAATFAPESLQVVDLHQVEPLLGLPYAGILGHDFLEQFVVRIDYDSQQVALFAPRSFAYAGPGESLPLWFEAAQSFVLGVLYADGRATPAKLKLDTGSLDALGLNGSFVQQTELVRGLPTPVPAMGAALGGAVSAYVVRLDSLALGGIVIAEPIAGYSVETARRGDAGTIGVALLSRFNLVFDYARRRLIVEQTGRTHRPMAYDASGLLLTGSGPELRGIAVLYVDAGSPAAAAGIEPGDALVSIDGKPAAEVGLTGCRLRLTRPGTARLVVARGAQRREVVLNLQPRL